MLNYNEFQQAIRLDFTDLPEDGTEFECMTQELLQAIGFHAERTGVGPDHGVDIVALETNLDLLGIKHEKKYITQCKHYAHSKRAVGASEITDILDTLARNRATGYLLVTSSEVSSSLKNKLEELVKNYPHYTILIWDHVTLAQRLNEHPAIIAKYFPTRLQQVKVRLPAMKGRKGDVRDRILAHQKEYVGLKFIPKLYVSRNIEETLYGNLLSPVNKLLELEDIYATLLNDFVKNIHSQLIVPQFLKVSVAPQVTFTWINGYATLNEELEKAAKIALSHNWKPIEDYLADGPRGIQVGFKALTETIKSYTKAVEIILQSFSIAAQVIKEAENEIKDPDSRLAGSSKKRTTRKKDYPWNNNKVLQSINLTLVNEVESRKVEYFLDFSERIERLKGYLKKVPTNEIQDKINNLQVNIHAIVDLAGSGKTNLCCRLALQLVSKSLVIFLTGKSLGNDFSDIINYLENEISTVLKIDKPKGLKNLCRILQEKDYPLTVIIDGINENSSPSAMVENLKNLSNLVREMPACILVTSRSEYWNYYRDSIYFEGFTEVMTGKLAKFTENEHGIAIQVYLDHYKLNVRLESKAWEQLKRPLLLRFFCEAYGNPERRSYRHLPPLKEVRLFHLFGEYCRVKFQNIEATMKAKGYAITYDEVEKIVYSIADKCLLHKNRALSTESVAESLFTNSETSSEIYRLLLDEDIIIEETLEPDKGKFKKYVAFVYEAFMEYLMAKVLLQISGANDLLLSQKINQLIKDEKKFIHVRGILTFILPFCVIEHPQTYSLILSQLRKPEYSETCIPTILNLWEADWKRGIWPVLEAITDHFLSAPVEVAAFIKDWVNEHQQEDFLHTFIANPKPLIKMLGDQSVELISSLEPLQQGLVVRSLLRFLETESSDLINEAVIKSIFRNPRLSKEIIIKGENLFVSILSAVIPALREVLNKQPYDRDWELLDLLGHLGEKWNIKLEDINHEIGRQYDPIIFQAIFDEYRFKRVVSNARISLGELFGHDHNQIMWEVERWEENPVYSDTREFKGDISR